MKRRISKALMALGAIALIVSIILGACWTTATDARRYMAVHARIETDSGLSAEGLKTADRALAAYLRGAGRLDYEDEVFGVKTRVFNDREIEHMKDVKALFDAARGIWTANVILGAALVIAAAFLDRRRLLARLNKSLLLADAGAAVILIIAAALIAGNFSGAFIGMHGLLFDNDLWLLNPETDLMIRLLPEDFFVGITKEIAKGALFAMLKTALTAGLVLLGERRWRR